MDCSETRLGLPAQLWVEEREGDFIAILRSKEPALGVMKSHGRTLNTGGIESSGGMPFDFLCYAFPVIRLAL